MARRLRLPRHNPEKAVMRRPSTAPVLLAYAAFLLVGVNAGVNGVLLAAQMDDYAVSRATLGLTFFAGSAGFVLAGVTAGALIHRFGTRIAVATGGCVYVLTALYAATRPAFCPPAICAA